MSRLWKYFEYKTLPQDSSTTEKDETTQQPHVYRFTPARLGLLVAVNASIFGVITALLLYIFLPSCPACSHQIVSSTMSIGSTATITPITAHAFPKPPPRLKCGYNATQALALNCTYDPLSMAWIPSYCPTDALDEFLAAASADPNDGTQLTTTGHWRYFYDAKGQNEMRGFDALSRIGPEVHYHTTMSEHRWHCAFMLMRVHKALLRAREGDLVVDATTLSERHARHCVMWLAKMSKGVDDDKLVAHGQIAYGSC